MRFTLGVVSVNSYITRTPLQTNDQGGAAYVDNIGDFLKKKWCLPLYIDYIQYPYIDYIQYPSNMEVHNLG